MRLGEAHCVVLGPTRLTAPLSCGGAGLDYVFDALAVTEIAAADGALSTTVSLRNSLIASPGADPSCGKS